MKNYSSYSYWLDSTGEELTPRQSLEESLDADVAILGAGYTGLWTAYYLLERNPSLSVVLLEQDISGFGASGRNGGWCTSKFPVSADTLVKRYGSDVVRALFKSLYETVDEIGRVCSAERIDAHYRKGGVLWIARGSHEAARNRKSFESYDQLGLGDNYRLLDEQQTRERARIANVNGALLLKEAAAIHPARLARGIARAVERRGGKIYERTQVTRFQSGSRRVLETARGRVSANSIVLAGEAYLTRFAELRRQLLPVYQMLVATEPLPEDVWETIGIDRGELIQAHQHSSNALARTADNRIVFGTGTPPYRFGGKIKDRFERDESIFQRSKEELIRWLPQLRGVQFTHQWGGVFGIPRDWMPTIAYDRRTGIATARGYSGQGVTISNLAGRVLADQILERETQLSTLPMIGHRSPNWEPELLRWLAVRYVRRSLERLDAKESRTGRASSGRSLAEWLSRR
jgi:glycine/D-amino acid oxidase-like deaminating enzyme